MKIILGTGQLGIAIMDELLKDNANEQLLLVNRSGKLNQQLPGNVQVMAADVTNKHELECIARDADVIYSCTDVPYQDWGAFYPATANALAYALSKTTAKLVFADNMYSYGNVAGTIMQEGMPNTAQTKKGRIRTAVINILLHSGKPFSDRVAFVKAADFIGPRIHKGIFNRNFLDKLYGGKKILLFGKPELPHTFTYINDFAWAMVNVGSSADTFGQVWHAPAAPAISVKEWISIFERQTGRQARVTILPKVIVYIAGMFDRLIKELYELAYQFEYPYIVSHSKYTTRFGTHFTDHETVAADTIAWYKSIQK